MQTIDLGLKWAKAHERPLSALSLAGGFAFDSYTFGRIDRPLTQLVFIVYLVVAGVSIAAQHVLESRPEGRRAPEKIRTILLFVTQFALGCLLSGFCVFYIRSAAVESSWPFLLAMAAIFIANEYLRRYHSRLVFSALLFFLSIYSYAILLVPVVAARIGPLPFLASGAIACLLFFVYMRALAKLGHDRYRSARSQIAIGVGVIAVLLNGFYFLKILPPLPLALSDAGIYHSIRRAGADYEVTAEEEPAAWRALFGTFPVEHVQAGARLYAYSAIFAPYRLSTRIEHRWEWRNPATGSWTPQQTVPIAIRGGRDEGFRAYSVKTAPRAGAWRVNITTADGRAIGRIRFSVELQAVSPAVSPKLLK